MSSEIKVDTISENTSANGVVIDSVTLKDGGVTATAASTITTADNTAQLTLTSTDADGNAGPVLKLTRDSGSPADEDFLGNIQIEMDNDAGDNLDAVSILAQAKDVSNASEDARLYTYVRTAGSMRDRFSIAPSETVFNEDSVDVDFRVETNNEANAFFVEGGSDEVGFFTANPSRKVHVVNGSADLYGFGLSSTASSGNIYGINVVNTNQAIDDNNSIAFLFNDSSTSRCIIYSDGDVKNHDGTFTSISSDERLKSNIVDANSQWDDIKAIKFRNFKKKDDIEQYGADNARTLLGVVAQEAESVTPKLVRNRDPLPEEVKLNSVFGTLYEDGDTIPEGKKIGDIKEVKEQVKTFKDSILFWKCAKALQEAISRIETLEAEVTALKGE